MRWRGEVVEGYYPIKPYHSPSNGTQSHSYLLRNPLTKPGLEEHLQGFIGQEITSFLLGRPRDPRSSEHHR